MLSHPTHSIPSPTPCNPLPPSLTRPRLLAGNHITTRALLSPTLSLFSPLSQLPDLTLPACPRQVDLLSAQLKRVNLPSHSLDLTTSSDPTDARHSHTAVGPARLPHTYARTYIHNLWVVAAHLTHIRSPHTLSKCLLRNDPSWPPWPRLPLATSPRMRFCPPRQYGLRIQRLSRARCSLRGFTLQAFLRQACLQHLSSIRQRQACCQGSKRISRRRLPSLHRWLIWTSSRQSALRLRLWRARP